MTYLHTAILAATITLSGSSMIGCATPMEELLVEADTCVESYFDPATGVVGEATEEARSACWADVNKRIEAQQRRLDKQEKAAKGQCPNGYVLWCVRDECSCVRRSEVQDAFRRAGMSM